MPASAVSLIDGPESLHTSNTGSTLYSARLVELLNTDASGISFSIFPAVAELAALVGTETKTDLEIRSFKTVQSGLVITSPLAGTMVSSGQFVTVADGFESGDITNWSLSQQ